jgi:hypothetical protein
VITGIVRNPVAGIHENQRMRILNHRPVSIRRSRRGADGEVGESPRHRRPVALTVLSPDGNIALRLSGRKTFPEIPLCQ